MVDVILSTGKCSREPFISFFKVAFGHVMSCEDNMESLKDEMVKLRAKRDSLLRRLDDAARESKIPTEQLSLWLHNADELQGKAAQMIGAYSKRLKVKCLCGISPNVCASYTNSKDAVKMMATAKELETNIPQDIAIDLAPSRYVERPGGSMVGMVGRDYEFNKLQDLAADDEVSIIGVYGMGGVGKTQLLDKFHNQSPLRVTHLMIGVDMDDCRTVKDTQMKFLEKLGLPLTEQENEEARACRMAEYLNTKSYVLILDNVRKEVDLKVVGVPIGPRQTKSKSKVIVETRIKSVCNRMDAENTKIRVKCLDANEAWSLFAEKAGKELIESDPTIRHRAEIMVKKCGGLPRALIAVGQEMAGKDTPELWRSAITKLENTPLEIHPMREVHDHLKRSISITWIERGMSEKKCLIRAGQGLAEAPKVDEWRGVERISLTHNRIRKLSEKPDSPCLLTLFLQGNPLEEICDGFFQSMKNLMWKEIDVLPSLFELVLVNLPELESLSSGSRPLAFPSLEILDVNAEKLRCIKGQLSWWNGLEWPEKHDDVKSKFEPIFMAEYPSTGMPLVIAHTYHGETPAASGLVALDKGPVFGRLEELVNNDEVSVIGIHGMGGVGKTRLLKTFRDKSPLRHKYRIIWIDMKGSHDAEEAQKAVADKLGFTGYRNKSREELARRIRVNLEERNFILILDNVWKAVDLNGVGIPTASHHTKCKVILATRLKDVCESMGAARVKVKCLQSEAAMSLFVEKAGWKLIESHPLIRQHAEGMVTECGGLPLALIAVGCAMAKKKTPEEWEKAMATLENTPLKIKGMKKVLARLKLSYEDLEDDKLRTCFLYCSTFPKDCDISKQVITNYCIGEGLLVDDYGASYDGLDILKAASLLGSGSNTDYVRMHPMIRALAVWIGGDKWLVRAEKDLTDAPDVNEWKEVERILWRHINHHST